MIDLQALAPIADASRIYAVGDIHGRLDLLLRMDEVIAADLLLHPSIAPVICYLGDYVDRGPASAGVIAHLSADLPSLPRRIFLKGNHEERFLAFLEAPERYGPRWANYGGREALESYGIGDAEFAAQDWPYLRDQLAAALPARHLEFFNALRLAARWEGYLFVHAGLDPEHGLETQELETLMWIREPFLSSDRDWGLRVVHGHVIKAEPVFRENRIGLDTGAYRSGILTCAAIDAGAIRILQARIG